MKKLFIISAALLLLASCTSLKEEFQPVFTGKYKEPAKAQPTQMSANTTIAELAAMYNGKPWDIDKNIIIAGKVSTTDKPGNFYKSLYIQDETGGIELKFGRNGLYNDYLPGQTLYVKCKGLTLGMYGFSSSASYGGNGMVQLGFTDPSGEYETSYLENPLLIDQHIFKGETGTEVAPEVITESQLPGKNDTQKNNRYIGKLVTLKGLKYANEAFVLLYINSNWDKKSPQNRVFLSPSNVASDPTAGITTWAMSKAKMTQYITSGRWDAFRVGSGNTYTGETVGDFKGEGSYPGFEKAAYSVSQYFKMGSKEIQIRTSGYCKFSDVEIPESVLSGKSTIDVTGILTLYQGNIQFTVNSIDDIVIND